MKHILTVCIGNICRSPIAQGLLAHQLPNHVVFSAGLSALVGQPADPLSVQVSASHGVDISAHRAQQISFILCQTADLILVMEQFQKSQLEQLFPSVRGKVFRLGQYGQFDIADPYRLPLDAFEAAYLSIAQGVAEWVPRIQKLS